MILLLMNVFLIFFTIDIVKKFKLEKYKQDLKNIKYNLFIGYMEYNWDINTDVYKYYENIINSVISFSEKHTIFNVFILSKLTKHLEMNKEEIRIDNIETVKFIENIEEQIKDVIFNNLILSFQGFIVICYYSIKNLTLNKKEMESNISENYLNNIQTYYNYVL